MMRSTSPAAALAPFAVLLAFTLGCGSNSQESGPVADSTANALEPAPDLAAAEASLRTGTWQWVGTNRPADRVEPADPSKYTISFQADTLASVQADCNSGSGRYTLVEGQRIEFGPMVTTLMGCPEGSQGPEYLRQLGAAEAWAVTGDSLSLTLELNGGTMSFVRRP